MSEKTGSSTTVEPPPSTSMEPPLTPPSTAVEPPLRPPSTTIEPSFTPSSTTVAPPSTTIEPPHTQPTTTVGKPSQSPTLSVEPIEVQEATQQAFALLKDREHDKALNLINESISRHPRSGRLHFTKGCLHLSIATVYDDDKKAKHLEDGIRSAQLAAEIQHNSVRCVGLLHGLYKELAVFNKESESDPTGLAIESPTDYGMADLLGEYSRFDDDMKWLEDIKSPMNLEYVAKKEDSEVMETERRKKQSKAIMKKLKDNNNDISMYKQFWNIILSDEKKRGFRKVNIEELENHFKSIKLPVAVDLLLEALAFAKQHKSWTFWECYDCVMKFGDYKSFSKHFWQVHWPDSQSMWKLDEELLIESIDMIGKGVWKPFDTKDAIKLSVFDKSKSSPVVEVPGKFGKSDDKESSKTTMEAPKWAFCDDIERTEILRRIHKILSLLCKTKCLSPSIVGWALEYAKGQFESIIQLSQFKDLGLKRLQVICFLGASQLTEMITFLEDVAHTCGLSENVVMDNSMLDNLSFDHHVFDIKERVLFSRDFTCLLVDERVLQGKLNATSYFDAVAGGGSAVSLSAVDVVPVPVPHDIVSWLYMGSNCREGLQSWESLIESRRSQAGKSHQVYLDKLSVIPETSATNDEIPIPSKLRAIQKLENMLLEEIEKEKSAEHESQPYMDLLKKRQTELQEIEDTSKRSELDAISEILEKAQEVQSGDRSGFEGCSIEDGSRIQEGAKQRDNCIKIALKRLKILMLKQLSCHEAIILRRALAFQRYVKELTNKTVCDYRSIVVPILKSFLQSQLKDLYEEVEEKSKAAEEAQLADEADKDSADVKQNQDKKKKNKKKKKKKKKDRKNKKPETSKESESTKRHQRMMQFETNELENAISAIEETAKKLRKIQRRQRSLHMEESRDLHLAELKIFWRTRMTDQDKKAFIRQRLQQMTGHLNSFDDARVKDGFAEATCFAKQFGTWKFMECICSMKFGDQISFDGHLSVCLELNADLGTMKPQPIRRDIEEFIMKASWKPVMEKTDEDHRERNKSLVKIRGMINLLMKSKFLTQPMVNYVFQLIIDGIPESQQRAQALSLNLICCLGASRLKGVIVFLQFLIDNFSLNEKTKIFGDEDDILEFDIKERVHFSGDFSFLYVDTRCHYFDAASAVTPAEYVCDVPSDDFLSWVCAGPSVERGIDLWVSLRESKKQQAAIVFEFIQNAQRRLERVCHGRCELVKELECIKAFKNKFDKELESRNKIPQYEAKTYTSILQKLKDELDDNAVSVNESKELEIISAIFKDEDVQIAQFDYEKWNQENSSRMVEHINREDDAVIKACLRLRQQNLFSAATDHMDVCVRLSLHLANNVEVTDAEVAAVDKRKDHRKVANFNSLPGVLASDKSHQIKTIEQKSNAFGTGLENNSGENNCFLNVIIQSLWHLSEFQKQFMKGSKSDHARVGAPCVVCALFGIFNDLHIASSNDKVDAISPTPLRIALSNLNEGQNLFQMGQMNDADEVLEVILRCVHRSYASSVGGLGNDCEGSSSACIMHSFFGMKILEAVYAENRGPSSIHQRHSFVLISINMNELRARKSMHGNRSFNVSVNLALAEIAKENAQVTDWIPPLVLRTVLSWPPTSNDEFDISAPPADISNNLNDLATQLDIGGHCYTLISMVCYYAQHYVCFIYGREQQSYALYNDKFIEVVGGWDDVKKTCIESGFKPVLVIYEMDVMDKSDVAREALSAEVAPGGKEKMEESWNNVGQGQTYWKHTEEDEYERRFQADIVKAVCQSLGSLKKKHKGLLLSTYATDESTTSQLDDVHLYVIIQSQWRLRLLRDELMSRPEPYHTHEGNPCLYCAYRDTYAALRIATKETPGSLSKNFLPVADFRQERLNLEKPVDDADMGVSASDYELKRRLVALVRKIVEDLEHERRQIKITK